MERQKRDPKNERKGGSGTGYQMCVDAFTGVCVCVCMTFTFSHFSRRFYPKRLTYVRLTMYTHFTITLMAHCTSGAIRGSVSCPRTLRQGIFNLLITKRLLYLLYHCRPRSMHPNNQNANKSDHAAQHGRNMTSQLPYHPLVPFLKMSDFNLS